MNNHCQIESIRLTNTFFDTISLDFSEHLNCIMGARGTGKTTILEFLRFALDLELAVSPQKKKEIQSLLESNLRDGVVEVDIKNEDGTLYRIERTLGSEPKVFNENGNRVNVNPSAFFSVDVFGQGEIEALAVNPEEQLSLLIDDFKKDELQSIKNEINDLKHALDENATKQIKLISEIREMRSTIAQFGDIEDRLNTIKKELGGIKSKELDEIEIERIKYRDCEFEAETLSNCNNWILDLQEELSRFNESLDKWEEVFVFHKDYESTNWDQISSLGDTIPQKIVEGKKLISQINSILSSMNKDVLNIDENIKIIHTKQIDNFQLLLSKYKTYQSQTQRLVELQKRVDELNKLKQSVLSKEGELKKQLEERKKIKEHLPVLIDRRFRARYEIANELTSLLGSDVKIDIERNALRSEYFSTLLDIFYGSGLKYTSIVEKIVNYYSPDEFATVIRRNDRASLVSALGFDDSRIDNLITHLKSDNGENIFSIESLIIDDKPAISLRIREKGAYHDQFRPAHLLSTGQRCTTMLPILLVKGTGPLIIDQPEDNLDNQYIYTTIIKLLTRISENRQLIFITHNPNIPVLGNAVFNIFLATEENKGKILSFGSIYDVKNEIVEYLEGGKEAFDKREEFYEYGT